MQRKSHGLIGDLKGSGNGNSDNHQALFLNQMSFKNPVPPSAKHNLSLYCLLLEIKQAFEIHT